MVASKSVQAFSFLKPYFKTPAGKLNDAMLASYKRHNLNLGHYLKLTEIPTEFKRHWIRPKRKILKMLNTKTENEEWNFSGSCVSATNSERIQRV